MSVLTIEGVNMTQLNTKVFDSFCRKPITVFKEFKSEYY